MNKKSKITGPDYLLLFLYLNNCEPINSAVRLTKMMFLFNEEIIPLLKGKGETIEKLPVFEPYNYGPFSKDLYEQIELFNNIAFIRVKNLNKTEELDEIDDWDATEFIDEMVENTKPFIRQSNGKYMQYSLLKLGIQYVEEIIKPEIPDSQIELLSRFKKRITESSIKSILRYVYINYPEMTENSLIKNEVLGK